MHIVFNSVCYVMEMKHHCRHADALTIKAYIPRLCIKLKAYHLTAAVAFTNRKELRMEAMAV